MSGLLFVGASLGITSGCLGSFIAGKIVEEAACSANAAGAERNAYVDIVFEDADEAPMHWQGQTRADHCDALGGVGAADGAYVFFDQLPGDQLIAFALGEDGGPLDHDAPTLLFVDRTGEADNFWWSGWDCTTDVSTYEDLGEGYAYIEGAGECFSTPLGADEDQRELAAQYSFANVVLIDPWAATAQCC